MSFGLVSPLFFILFCLFCLSSGSRCSLPTSFRFLACHSFLESLVWIDYVCAKFLTCLSPGNNMIPDAGIMACPMG
jgi:hypothetical protein